MNTANQVTAFNFNTSSVHVVKLSIGQRGTLGKAASAICRDEGWIIKSHPFTNAGMYPIKAFERAAKNLKLIK